MVTDGKENHIKARKNISFFLFSDFLSQFLPLILLEKDEKVRKKVDRQKEEAVGAIRTIVSMTCRLLKSERDGVRKEELKKRSPFFFDCLCFS